MPDINLTNEQKKALYDVLIDLSHQERNCYLFHTMYLYSYSQIAEILGISISSVQTYMERARKKIKENTEDKR